MSSWETISARVNDLVAKSAGHATRITQLIVGLPKPRHVVLYDPDCNDLYVGLDKNASDADADAWAKAGLTPTPLDVLPADWGVAPWVLLKRSVDALSALTDRFLDRAAWTKNALLCHPDALAGTLTGSRLCLRPYLATSPVTIKAGREALVQLTGEKTAFSIADQSPMSGGLDSLSFLPAIDHNSFVHDVWNDHQTPMPIRAATIGLLNNAQYASGGQPFISPYNIAQVSDDFHRGLLVGKSLGAMAGVAPNVSRDLKDQGVWANVLTRIVPQAFPDPVRIF